MHNSVIENGIANGFMLPMTPKLKEHIAKYIVAGKGVSFHATHSGSCLMHGIKRYVDFFINAGQVYAPVHFVLLLIRLSKKDGKTKEKVTRAISGLIKSCLFAATMAYGVPCGGCWMKGLKFRGFLNEADVFYLGFLWASFFLFESHTRWGEMSIWVLANWTEGFKYSLEKRGMMPNIPYLHVSDIALLLEHCACPLTRRCKRRVLQPGQDFKKI